MNIETIEWIILAVFVFVVFLSKPIKGLMEKYKDSITAKMSLLFPKKNGDDNEKKSKPKPDEKGLWISTVNLVGLGAVGLLILRFWPDFLTEFVVKEPLISISVLFFSIILIIVRLRRDEKEREKDRKDDNAKWSTWATWGLIGVIGVMIYMYTFGGSPSPTGARATVSAAIAPIKETIAELTAPAPPKWITPPNGATILYYEEIQLIAGEWSKPLGEIHPKALTWIRNTKGETWRIDHLVPIYGKIADGMQWYWKNNFQSVTPGLNDSNTGELRLKADVNCKVVIWVWK